MKAWTEFLQGVLPEVGSCPVFVAERAVRDAAIQFLAATKIWQEKQTPYTITAATPAFPFILAVANTRVAQIMTAVDVNGDEVQILTAERCDELYPKWKTGLSGNIEALTQLDPDNFYVIPQPSSSTTLLLVVALQPTRAATQGPDFLLDDYYDAICNGAKSRLMLMNNASWANPQLAAVNKKFFDDQVTAAMARRNRAFGRAATRVRARFI